MTTSHDNKGDIGGGDGNDYNRPRRPNADTLSYLRSLPLHEPTAHAEVSTFLNHHNNNNNNETSPSSSDPPSSPSSSEPAEPPQILTASLAAINEIHHEIASLAGDEYGSQIVESLARIAGPYSTRAARILVDGIVGYMVHLSTHRYGSHVVQTILQSAITVMNNTSSSTSSTSSTTAEDTSVMRLMELEDDDDNDDDELPQLQELIITLITEITPYAKELAEHICGSHVIRTLICVLGGLREVVPSHLIKGGGNTGVPTMMMVAGGSRRGKVKKKKKKKRKGSNPMDIAGGGGATNTASYTMLKPIGSDTHARIDSSAVEFQKGLASMVHTLSGFHCCSRKFQTKVVPPGELQRLACHPSAGPLLILLLRVLTLQSKTSSSTSSKKRSSPSGGEQQVDTESSMADFRLGIAEPSPQFQPNSDAERLAKRILCWDDDDTTKNGTQPYAGDVIYGLSGEMRGSRLLECILHSSHDTFFHSIACAGGLLLRQTNKQDDENEKEDAINDYLNDPVGNYIIQTLLSNLRTSDQADDILPRLTPSIASGYLLDPTKKRRGVFWRIVECSAKFGVGQEMVLDAMCKGFGGLSRSGGGGSGVCDVGDCIPRLLDLTNGKGEDDDADNGDDGDNNNNNEQGVGDRKKRVGRMSLDVSGARSIHHLLKFEPKICGEVLEGIVGRFDAQDLELIANDGLGSRCIMDAILNNPKRTSTPPFQKTITALLQKLLHRVVALSVERVGHHTVRNLFLALPTMDDRAMLCGELVKGLTKLNGNAIGRGIVVDCCLKEFGEDNDGGGGVWRESVKRLLERESFLRDIVGDEDNEDGDGAKKKKRKRKKKKKKGMEE